MNGTAGSLRAAILEQTADQTLWNVYADWLEEHGHPATASTREFASRIGQEDGLIAQYVQLNSAALKAQDSEHIAFCAQAATASSEDDISDLLNDQGHDITESEAFAWARDTTNADMWRVEEVEIEKIAWEEGRCRVQCSYWASGQQIEDRMFAGNAIAGTLVAVIDAAGAVIFEEVTAEVQYDTPEGEAFDPEAE
jgi:uncharacterized protein (TIGR02996 family)